MIKATMYLIGIRENECGKVDGVNDDLEAKKARNKSLMTCCNICVTTVKIDMKR